MQHRLAHIFWSPGISAAAGIISTVAVITFGVVAIAHLPPRTAIASDQPTQPLSLAPYFVGASAHFAATGGVSSANGVIVDPGRDPNADGHGQQTAQPGVTHSSLSLAVPEGNQAAYTVRLDNAMHGYIIEGLDGGQSYDLRVIAVNEAGESEPSEVLTAVAPSDG